MDRPGPPATSPFWLAAAGALALHALLLFGTPGLHGGADLLPHLRLVQLMGEEPALRTVYAPAYHVLGALAAPLVGLESYPKLFGLLGALALVAGFRFFQRSAALPDAASAFYALFPYAFALSWCLPKTETLGYGLSLVGLGLLLRGRRLLLALVVTAGFFVHTASALFLGIAAGILALARADWRSLAALAAGAVGALPLLAAHVAAGCSPAEALLLSRNDYLRASADWSSIPVLDVILLLASPLALALAALGAAPLWRRDRPLALTCAALVLLYLNELWLAPFETRTSLDLLRGLSVLAIPLSVSGGIALAERRRLTPVLLAGCAVWALVAALEVVPRACHVRPVAIEELRGLRVERCTFRWSQPRADGGARRRVAASGARGPR